MKYNKPVTEDGIRFAEMAELVPLITERLGAGQSVELSPRGKSMMPMLREGKDSIVLSAVSGRLKKHDIPLYKRTDGSYVLHRIVKVHPEGYTVIGDGQYVGFEKVTDEQIVAHLTAFRRKNKLVSCERLTYKLYAFVWCGTRPVRRFMYRVKRKLKRMFTKRK